LLASKNAKKIVAARAIALHRIDEFVAAVTHD
jgi:hypothetical protein